ncbi:MAG: DNA-3-methyladenine glycosylase [Bacteroidota bacterium]
MGKRLPKSFFIRDDVNLIAKELLGKYLMTKINGVISGGMIVEAEAYRTPDDTACHATKFGRTSRTEIMYKEGGHAYVYICYGIHDLFNVVTGKENDAHAVLIRAIEPSDNLQTIMERRNIFKLKSNLGAGPGVVTKALGITMNHNGINMLSNQSSIWLEDREIKIQANQIATGPRVGCENAGVSAFWPWRYVIKGNKFVSRPKL